MIYTYNNIVTFHVSENNMTLYFTEGMVEVTSSKESMERMIDYVFSPEGQNYYIDNEYIYAVDDLGNGWEYDLDLLLMSRIEGFEVGKEIPINKKSFDLYMNCMIKAFKSSLDPIGVSGSSYTLLDSDEFKFLNVDSLRTVNTLTSRVEVKNMLESFIDEVKTWWTCEDHYYFSDGKWTVKFNGNSLCAMKVLYSPYGSKDVSIQELYNTYYKLMDSI